MFIFKKKSKMLFNNLDKVSLNKNILNGNCYIPGDKSISQRAIIMGLISIGTTKIEGVLDSEDVYHTLKAVESLGARIKITKNILNIVGVGLGNYKSPNKPIYMGNSGTGTRLLIGLVAGSNAKVTFYGDSSLSKRPMERIIRPLARMGAKFIFNDNIRLPITVIGAGKRGFTFPIKYNISVSSAQVKSAILLAALTARGKSSITEPSVSRNYTEKMLKERGVHINNSINKSGKNKINISGLPFLKNCDINVPGDPSSAAFIGIACLITKGSKIIIKNVLNDPFRLKIFKILKKMKGNIKIIKKNKYLCDIIIQYSKLKNITVEKKDSTALIDEYLILSIAAASGKGIMKMKGLEELRYKESDRFLAIKEGLIKCGVKVNSKGNDMEIFGSNLIKGGCVINAEQDHRVAMSFNILNLISEEPIKILGNKAILTSFPNFFELFKKLGKKKNNG